MKYNEIVKRIKEEGIGAFNYHKEIGYKSYLPYNIKFALANTLATNVLDEDEKGVLSINVFKLKMIESFLALRYTNIEKEDNDFDIDDYDLLESSGFYDSIKERIYSQEENGRHHGDFAKLCEYLYGVALDLVENSKRENTGINGVIKQVINTTVDKLASLYSTTEGKKTVNSFLKELNKNTELKDITDRFFEGLNLTSAREELLKKIANTKFSKKEENKTIKKDVKTKGE